MTQPNLFGESAGHDAYGSPLTAPHVPGSPTSKAAADAIQPELNALQRKVLFFLMERGNVGATDEEMQRYIPMSASTQRPRRVELVGLGLVRDSGKTRETVSGRQAVVWVLV